VQQIVRDQLDRRNANPADDFALLQIARLERALSAAPRSDNRIPHSPVVTRRLSEAQPRSPTANR
jgi:hypothetical protein